MQTWRFRAVGSVYSEAGCQTQTWTISTESHSPGGSGWTRVEMKKTLRPSMIRTFWHNRSVWTDDRLRTVVTECHLPFSKLSRVVITSPNVSQQSFKDQNLEEVSVLLGCAHRLIIIISMFTCSLMWGSASCSGQSAVSGLTLPLWYPLMVVGYKLNGNCNHF